MQNLVDVEVADHEAMSSPCQPHLYHLFLAINMHAHLNSLLFGLQSAAALDSVWGCS